MTSTIVWFIVFMTATGQRVELPNRYDTDKECIAAAEAIQGAHPGVSAQCVAGTAPISEERARQLVNEEWWRRQAQEEEEQARKKKP